MTINPLKLNKMNKKLFLMTLAILSLTFYSCNDDDDNLNVTSEYETIFKSMYPNAERVSWEKEREYFVADFWRNDMNAEAEAWFDNLAEWKITVTEISYEAFPQAVKDGFQSSEYSQWRIEDTDMIERNEMETVYVIEVEQNNLEYDLYFTADGTLVKAIPDNDNDHSHYIPGEISVTISKFITDKYPGAKITETEKDNNMIEVDILDGKTHRELLFTNEGEWKYTKTEVSAAQVTEIVMEAFKKSQYANYRIDDIDFYDTADSDFYIFELDSEPNDIHLKIFTDGTIGQ